MKISVILTWVLALIIAQGCVAANDGDGVAGYTNAQCLECHEEIETDQSASVHVDILCLECHIEAAEEDHQQVAKTDCRQCHDPHDEKRIHDAHSRVTCRACHVKGGVPATDPESGKIIFSGRFLPDAVWPPHQAIQSQADEPCSNCHFQGNALGASSMELPAKGIWCMPCHVATFSVGDKTTLVSLFVFLVGMVGLANVWFSGSMAKRALFTDGKPKVKTRFKPSALFWDRPIVLLKPVFMEVVLLQRFFQRSKTRWMIHALIFFPFLFRLGFGLTALLLSIFLPDSAITIAMLDKNHAMRALFFDLTGLMMLAGSMATIFRKEKTPNTITGSLPEPGPGMPAMIGLIVLLGFILEGVRITMTGWPGGSGWAFLGYAVSLMFKGMTGLTEFYGYVWYTHAILTGAFMALIPFTRMAHIITAPIALIINLFINDRSRAKDCS